MLFSQKDLKKGARGGDKISPTLKRVIVAVIALPPFYLYITKLPPIFFLLLLTTVSVLAQMEFHAMYKTNRLISFSGIISGVILLCLPLIQPSGFSLQTLSFIFPFMLMACTRLFLIKDPSSSLKDISPAVVGFLYIPNLLLAQWHLRLRGYEWILFLYGCVWASDSLAYYIGKGMGKRRLYKEVSPNKTIAGAFGSVIGGMLSALLLGKLMMDNIAFYVLIAMGIAIGSITIVGDLIESMFKRDAGVKDSGSFIPGHGGILDKIDGALFAGPLLYWITLIL
ncbi:phosphatidate cytidylyltransferase [Dissulfurispira thermophila]|uniref:phosphatidate cytidylyltransferase n=1 Tax=Dissulfurispira thermophila TaxID=2715679 RepID=UPI00193E5697|nr:phosphatidate cytidylyltransferase [Dissulfurispira thermophila]